MRRSRLLIVAVLGLALPAPARAQAVTAYTLGIYQQGATAPQTTTVLAAANFLCGQTPKLVVSGTVTNPSHVVMDDPATPTTADCVYTDPGTGPLLALPFGPTLYTAALFATNGAGSSAYSAMSNPFARPGVAPGSPTGVRIH